MAEVAAGLLASPFVKIAVDKLGSAIGEQANLLWSFSRDLENMKGTMESISAALKDAEMRSVTEESVRLWLKRLKNAALDISDMLDDYQHDVDYQATAKLPRIISRFPITRNKIALANKMKNMREELRTINEQFRSFEFTKTTSSTIWNQHYDQRETTSDVIEEQIVGRDGEKKTIINLLSTRENNDETMILPIYGLGGIGKSTLAQLVYNDMQFKNYNHRIWVYVSQDFSLNKIGSKIISQLPIEGSKHNTDSLQVINRCLDSLLHGKKVLVVLDDLWQENVSELDKLKNMLHVGKKGYMVDVIVTTRKEDIANKICTNGSFELLPLKNDMCWDIIKRYSQFEKKYFKEQLSHIGLDIAKKCGGVALAAQALGYMLKSKDLSEWLQVNNSDIWNESSSRDDNLPCSTVLPSLKLSYECMPPHLKLCFAYCAIFPKGHDIVQDYLIHQWTALDFIEPTKRIGEEYINQLLGMSFLEHSKIPSNSKKHVVRYTMHGMVHDLAKSVIGDEIDVFDVSPNISTRDKKYCRYALLTKYEQPSKLSENLPSKLRALHFSDIGNLHLPRGAFSFAKYLRILDFSECSSTLFPAVVGELKQLKYLICPRMENKRFPKCITEMSKLQFLNLNWSSQICALPKSIGKLGCLIHLDLSGCSNLARLPEEIGSLVNLRYLDISGCEEIGELPVSFMNLQNLLHLDMACCNITKDLSGALRGLTALQHLDLTGYGMHILFASGDLENVLGSLTNLKYLSLEERIQRASATKRYVDLYVDFIGRLTNLEHLDLSGNGCFHLPESIGNLKRLRTLNLSRCRDLKLLPKSIGEIKLRSLLMEGCPDELIAQAYSLTHYPVTLPLFIVHKDDVGYCSNLHVLEGINVGELDIRYLEKVRFLEEACEAKMLDKQNLSKLSLTWTSGDRFLEDRDLLEQLIPPRGLKEFALEGYSNSSFPSWLMDISHHLPNLVDIRLTDLPTCSSLPPLGQLPNLKTLWLHDLPCLTKIGPDFCGGKEAFYRLLDFRMERMEGLKEWSTTYSVDDGVEEFMFPVLDELRILNCPRLRLKPCLPTFRTCEIRGSDQVISSSEEVDRPSDFSSPAASIELWEISTLCQSSRMFHHFPALQELTISQCSKLTSLPESMRSLASLQSLKLDWCHSMTELPEWLSDLPCLRSLCITHCPGIKCFPSCIQKLTNLRTLKIRGNQELNQWCNLEENKMKLAHIQNII